MNQVAKFACCVALLAGLATAGLASPGLAADDDDVADTPAKKERIGDDAKKQYLLIRQKDEQAPPRGFGLVVILPGGDGSGEFSAFVRRMRKFALPAGYLVAEPIAAKWTAKPQVVWPTAKLTEPGAKAKFTTEDFVAEVIDDVARQEKLDPARVFVLGWSSSGTSAYTIALLNPKVRGAFVACSVYKPDVLPPLDGAKGKAFYLYHSPADFIPLRMPEQAVKDLEQHGAKVILKTYAGGHGWRGDMFGDQRTGIEWLEANATLPEAQTPAATAAEEK